MIKQHTARSLGRYLGENFLVKGTVIGDQIAQLLGLEYGQNGIRSSFRTLSGHLFHRTWAPPYNIKTYFNIYPILKDYKKLVSPMMFEGKNIKPVEYVYKYYNELTHCDDDNLIKNLDMIDDPIEIGEDFVGPCPYSDKTSSYSKEHDWLEVVEKLIELGFGAIEDKESPTGYVDLWGYPCVLYKD